MGRFLEINLSGRQGLDHVSGKFEDRKLGHGCGHATKTGAAVTSADAAAAERPIVTLRACQDASLVGYIAPAIGEIFKGSG